MLENAITHTLAASCFDDDYLDDEYGDEDFYQFTDLMKEFSIFKPVLVYLQHHLLKLDFDEYDDDISEPISALNCIVDCNQQSEAVQTFMNFGGLEALVRKILTFFMENVRMLNYMVEMDQENIVHEVYPNMTMVG